MITLDLRHQQITLEELFRAARSESVLIVTDEGQEYILEAADEFDHEIEYRPAGGGMSIRA